MSHTSAQPVVYRIDGDDRLVAVNDAWCAFARENGAPQLADGALGTSIWDAVHGAETRHVWEVLLSRARAGVAVDVPYRCDAADERRRMRMSLRAFPGGVVEFVSETVGVEPREPVPSYELLRACSWCNRFFVGEWVEPERAVAEAALLDGEPPAFTHGMCPDCSARILSVAAPR